MFILWYLQDFQWINWIDEVCYSEELLHIWDGNTHLRVFGTYSVKALWTEGIDWRQMQSRAEPWGIPKFKHQVMGEMAEHIGRDTRERCEEDEENVVSGMPMGESFKEGGMDCMEWVEGLVKWWLESADWIWQHGSSRGWWKKQIQYSGGGGSQAAVSGWKNWRCWRDERVYVMLIILALNGETNS